MLLYLPSFHPRYAISARRPATLVPSRSLRRSMLIFHCSLFHYSSLFLSSVPTIPPHQSVLPPLANTLAANVTIHYTINISLFPCFLSYAQPNLAKLPCYQYAANIALCSLRAKFCVIARAPYYYPSALCRSTVCSVGSGGASCIGVSLLVVRRYKPAQLWVLRSRARSASAWCFARRTGGLGPTNDRTLQDATRGE